jgi:hypothetical protein
MKEEGESDMRLRSFVWVAVGLCTAGVVHAQEKTGSGTFTLPPVTIVGRIQRPIATVDVNRVRPALVTAELKAPSFEAIAKSVSSDPF